MAKKSTPHLDKWIRAFKGSLKEGASEALRSVMPNVVESATSTANVAREAKDVARSTATNLQNQMRKLKGSAQGREANSIIDGALDDIKSGSYSLDRLSDSSYDAMDDFDSSLDGIKIDASDPASVAAGESKRNTALLGKVVAEGNAASIAGMQQMTNTLASVNVKTSKATGIRIENVAMAAISQTTSYLAGISSRLDMVNANLGAIIQYNNETALESHKAAIDFFADSSDKLYKMGATLSELMDFVNNQKEIERSKDSYDPYDFSYGFNAESYRDMIKNNFKNSMIGMMLGMGKMYGDSLSSDPMTSAISAVIKGLIPKSMKKSLGRFDKVFTNSMENLLYSIGDMTNSTDIIKSTIGEIFGKRRPRFQGISMGNFKKDSMSWNGLAQKTLVEVIPSYLSSIESAITGNERRYYDMNAGMFMTDTQVRDNFMESLSSKVEMGMGEFTRKLNKALNKSNIDDDAIIELQDSISQMVSDQVLKSSGNSVKEDTKTIRETLENRYNISGNDLRDIMIEFTDGLRDTQKSVNSFIRDMEESVSGSVYRNLHNTYKQDTSDLYQKADIFNGTLYTEDGRKVSSIKDPIERAKQERLAKARNRKGGLFDDFIDSADEYTGGFASKLKNRFTKKSKKEKRHKVSEFVDNTTNLFYDVVNGQRSSKKAEAASSQETIRSGKQKKDTSEIDDQTSKITSGSYELAIRQTPAQALQHARQVDNIMKEQAGFDNRMPSEDDTNSAIIANVGSNSEDAKEGTLKSLVLSLHSHFLQPMVSGIFGKHGFFHNLFQNEQLQKLKTKLFDEKTGLFAPITRYFKDGIDYMKYIFTGKGYTNRNGKTFKENTNSVFDHLANGYNFLYTHTMRYLFGDDYQENDTFKKYFKWMDWKSKRDAKHAKRLEKEQGKVPTDAGIGEKAEEINNESIIQSASIAELPSPEKTLLLEDKKQQSIQEASPRASMKNELSFPDSVSDSSDVASFEIIPKDEAENMREIVVSNLVTASEKAGTEIVAAGTAASSAILGDFEDETKNRKIQQDAKKSFFQRIKEHIPKMFSGGIIGGAIGASVGLHGAGLLGSLFLPGGAIGGAILGMGATLLTKSKGFMEFVFGKEDENGKKVGGLFSQKSQDFLKKSLPIIIGGGVLGGLKSLVLGGLGNGLANGPGGFLLRTLLPGGAIGGAILGTGIAMMKHNERFREILFGKKDDDGKRIGGTFSKASNIMSKAFSKSTHFLKGGFKGLLAGAGTGLALSQAGVIGSALSLGGPIGMGIAGLGVGIASQTHKFQDLLFGTATEFDKDGNVIKREKDGLLYKVRNMLVLNVFEPIKNSIQEKAIDFAYWAKKQIMFPFRLAFGPIFDSLKGIKKDISDAVHDAFHSIADTVGTALKEGIKKLFSPFTKVLKGIGWAMSKTVETSLKLALSPVTGGLKVLSLLTNPKRFKEENKRRKTQFTHMKSLFNSVNNWTDQDTEEYGGSGIFAKVKKFRDGWDAERAAYNEEMKRQGYNTFDWRSVYSERRALSKEKNLWKNEKKNNRNIQKFRSKLAQEFEYGAPNVSEDRLRKIQKQAKKFGYRKEMFEDAEALRLFMYHNDEWQEKYNPLKKGKGDSGADWKKDGIKIQESKEAKEARRGTKEYQEKVMAKFDDLTREFTKYAAQEAMKRRSNLSMNDIRAIDKNLADKGLTWDDVGFNPSEMANMETVDENDMMEFMRRKYEDGDLQTFDEFMRETLKRDRKEKNDTTSESSDEATIKYERVDDIAEEISSEEAAKMDTVSGRNPSDKGSSSTKNDDAIINGVYREVSGGLNNLKDSVDSMVKTQQLGVSLSGNASSDDIEDATGVSVSATIDDLAIERRKDDEESVRKEKEAKESEQAKGLHTKDIKENEEDTKKEKKSLMERIKDTATDKKSGLFGKITGFFGSVFGGLGSLFTSGAFWKTAGVLTILGGAFGDKIKEWLGPAFNFIGENVTPYISSAIGAVGTWLTDNLPSLVKSGTKYVIDNMGSLMQGAIDIVTSAAGTLGKMVVNGVSSKLFGLNVFKDESSEEKTYNSEEDLQKEIERTGKNYYDNGDGTYTVLNKNQRINPETGEISTVTSSSAIRSTARLGYRLATSKTTRAITKKGAKAAAYATAFSAGLLPGLVGVGAKKAVTGTYKATKWAGKKAVDYATDASGKRAAKAASKAAKIEKLKDMPVDGFVNESDIGKYYKSQRKAAMKEASKEVKSGAVSADDLSSISESINRHYDNMEAASIKTLKKSGDKTLEEISDEAIKKVAKKKVSTGGEVKGLQKLVKSIGEKFKGAANLVSKWIGATKFGKWVSEIVDTLYRKIATSDNRLVRKVFARCTEEVAQMSGKVITKLIPVLNIVFTGYDIVNGLFNASYLFDVDREDTTWGMNAVSAILNTLFGSAVGAFGDILLEIGSIFSGKDYKKEIASSLYKFVAGGDAAEELDLNQSKMELARLKYNQQTGQNLDSASFKEVYHRYDSDMLTSGYRHVKDWITNSQESKDAKKAQSIYNKISKSEAYDYQQYKKSGGKEENYDLDTSSNDAKIPTPTGNTTNYANADNSLAFGPGPRRSVIGYGGLRQDDSRWANMSLGNFADGSPSTMATGGCGPTAMSMLTGKSPVTVANYAKTHGYIKDGGATSGLFTEGAADMGLHANVLTKGSVKSSLENGQPIILSGKGSSSSSPYTEAGHVVVASGLDRNGDAIVNDPMRGETRASISSLTQGMTHGWSYSKDGSGPSYGRGLVIGYGGDEAQISPTNLDTNQDLTKIPTTIKVDDDFIVDKNTTEDDIYHHLKKKFPNGNDSIQKSTAKDMYRKLQDRFNPKYTAYDDKTAEYVDKYLYKKFKNRQKDPSSWNYYYKSAIDYGKIKKLSYNDFLILEKAVMDKLITDPKSFSIRSGVFDSRSDAMIELSKLKDSDGSVYDESQIKNMCHLLNSIINKGGVAMTNTYSSKADFYNRAYNWASKSKGGDIGTQVKLDDQVNSKTKMSDDAYKKVNKLLKYLGFKGKPVNTATLGKGETVDVIDTFKDQKVVALKYLTQILMNKYGSTNSLDAIDQLKNKKNEESIYQLKLLYRYFINGGYSDNKVMSKTLLEDVLSAATLSSSLGGSGEKNGFQYRNGFPFFLLNDSRWSSVQWRNSTIGHSGDDLASIAMVTSTFGDNIITPDYVYNEWLTKYYPEKYWSETSGIKPPFYEDGGFNAMKASQVDGKRLISTPTTSINEIKSALKEGKPVIMKGKAGKDTIFGGKNGERTIVGVGGNSAVLAVNNPFEKSDSNSIFDIGLLNKPGALSSAYIVTGPDGQGFNDRPIDFDKKSGGDSDYTDIRKKSGLEKITGFISNIINIGSHLVSSFIDGSKYKSITETNGIEDDGPDAAGIGNTRVYSQEEQVSEDTAQTEGTETASDQAIINETDASGSSQTTTPSAQSQTQSTETQTPATPAPSQTPPPPVYGSGRDFIKGAHGGAFRDIPIGFGKKATKKKTSSITLAPIGQKQQSGATPLTYNNWLDNYYPGKNWYESSGIENPLHKDGGINTSKEDKKKSSSVAKSKSTTTQNNKKKKDKKKANTTTDAAQTIENASNQQVGEAGTVSTQDISNPGTTIMNDLGAVLYASQAGIAGTDYKTAKQQYYERLNNTNTLEHASADGSPAGLQFTSSETLGDSLPVPEGIGKIHTYMGWQCITSPSSLQYKLKSQAESYDSEGFGKVGDRYAVAMKPFYGEIGDYLNITQTDGFTYKVALADHKGTENEKTGDPISKYAHGNAKTGYNMVEFVVDKRSWYSKSKGGNASAMHANVGSKQFHPEFGVNIQSVQKAGSFWKDKNAKTTASKSKDTDKAYGIGSPSLYSRAIGYGGNWLATVQAVKAAIAAQKPGYSQSNWITITVNGKTDRVRTDCSGFVSACCRFYGVNMGTGTSSTFTSRSYAPLSKAGFSSAPWPGWNNLVPGDIIARNGHVEIYAGQQNGRPMVYNCGSSNSVNNPNATYSAKEKSGYTTVWRPAEAGSVSNLLVNSANVESAGMPQQQGGGGLSSPLSGLFSFTDMFNFGSIGFGNGPESITESLNGTITSGYGNRRSSLGNEYHRGIDIAAERGSSIKSPVSGEVVADGSDIAGYGNYTVIRDKNGYNHLFAHMDKPSGFGVGSIVGKDDVIGEVGSTGRSTGDHLHYEIRRNGSKYSTVDPSTYPYKTTNDLSVHTMNHVETEHVGSGNRDVSLKESSDKLTVALNSDGIETKLDTLIEVMRDWSARDAKVSRVGTITTNNTTNVSYGSGSKQKKPMTKKRKSSKATTDVESMALAEIHKAIAMK